ncbi:GNAT family N-acetyltransferase [Rufibacter roseus]|uniref:GNAT family N-acetyltransferase n=1 Tax=Rufibacter roseus TaxID=1567108 RepID=A0ABW2DMR2_9BACT|nr:GNAT family N-acetyltransferase [Rufibacter roseus]
MLTHSLTYSQTTAFSTSRLWLRPYDQEMALPFWQLIHTNRDRLQADFPDRTSAVITLRDAEKRIRTLRYQWNTGDMYSFGLWSKETGNYIGDITLRRMTPGKPFGEVGYYLSAEAEGSGFATEALKGLVKFAFQELRMESVKLRCAQDNIKSQKVAERCGFTRSQTLTIAISKNAEKEDRPIYTYCLRHNDTAARFLWNSV